MICQTSHFSTLSLRLQHPCLHSPAIFSFPVAQDPLLAAHSLNTGFPEKQTGKNPRELFPVALTGFTKERHRTLRRVLPTNQPTARLTLEALHLGFKRVMVQQLPLASPKRVTTFYILENKMEATNPNVHTLD